MSIKIATLEPIKSNITYHHADPCCIAALDAEAQKVTIILNPQTLEIDVHDDGTGIHPDLLKDLGDMSIKSLGNFGKRGGSSLLWIPEDNHLK